MKKKMLPSEAARRMGCSTEHVRKSLIAGSLPFGNASKTPGSSRWTYYINAELFGQWEAGKLTTPRTIQP